MSRYHTGKFCEAPANDFLCPICEDVLDDPSELPCRHTFCKECILKNGHDWPKSCPLCRQQYQEKDLKAPALAFQNILNSLTMRCNNEACNEIITLEDYIEHQCCCSYEPVICPFEQCEQQMFRKDVEEHKAQCEYRPIPCPEGCGDTVQHRDIDHHFNTSCILGKRACTKCEGVYDYRKREQHDCVRFLKGEINTMKEQHDNQLKYQGGEIQSLKAERQDRINSVNAENQNLKGLIVKMAPTILWFLLIYMAGRTFYDSVARDMSGNCEAVDPSSYSFGISDDDGLRKAKCYTENVRRTMWGTKCKRNGPSRPGYDCETRERPNKLQCEGPAFENEGTEAVYRCLSDRFYPDSVCAFKEMNGNKTMVHTTMTNSDKSVVCEGRIAVTGKNSGMYTYTATVHSKYEFYQGLPGSVFISADDLPPLILGKTALPNSLENGRIYDYPQGGFLLMEFEVTGNPPPNRYSVSVKTDENSTSTMVPKDYFLVHYTPKAGSADGTISLNITGGLNRFQTSYYTFRVDNGVVGSSILEYMFTVLNGIVIEDDKITSQCGALEEGSYHTFACSTTRKDFDSYGPWFEIDGKFHRVASCNSEGKCYSDDDTRFSVKLFFMDGRREVHVGIAEVNSSMTRVKCYNDNVPLHGVECDISVYAIPTKPVCAGPVFEHNDTATFTCTADRILPVGKCDFILTDGDEQGLEDVHVSTTNSDSSVYKGHKKSTCKLQVTVTGGNPGVYKFLTSVIPDIEGVPTSAKVSSDSLPPLSLSQIELFGPRETCDVFDASNSGSLTLKLHWSGNPKPYMFALSVRYDETSYYRSVSGTFFAVSTSEDVIELTVIESGYDTERDSFFCFRADNGIVGGDGIDYMFMIRSSLIDKDADRHEGGSGDNHLPLIIDVVIGIVMLVSFFSISIRIICVQSEKEKKVKKTYGMPCL